MLRMLGADEVNSILAEQAKIPAVIQVNCDFCNKQYNFDAIDAAQMLLEPAQILAASHAEKISKAKH